MLTQNPSRSCISPGLISGSFRYWARNKATAVCYSRITGNVHHTLLIVFYLDTLRKGTYTMYLLWFIMSLYDLLLDFNVIH